MYGAVSIVGYLSQLQDISLVTDYLLLLGNVREFYLVGTDEFLQEGYGEARDLFSDDIVFGGELEGGKITIDSEFFIVQCSEFFVLLAASAHTSLGGNCS